MNRYKKYFQNPMLIVLVIILLFFTPQAIYSAGESRRRGVVTAIGIDKAMDEYEVSLLTFIPNVNQSFKEVSSVISGKGDTLADAIYNAQTAMGRRIGLAHAKTTVVSEELLQEDISAHIDYLSRVSSLPENTVIICTDKSAKELLEASYSLESNVGLQLEQIVAYNDLNLYVTDTSLESFYKGYYSMVKSSIIGYLSVVEGETKQENRADTEPTGQTGSDQVDTSGSKGSGESGSETSSKTDKRIVNNGEAGLIKEGKLAKRLTVDELNGINLINQESIRQNYTVENVTQQGKTVDMTYKVKSKTVNVKTRFENGVPVFDAHIVLGMELVEVNGEHANLKVNTEFSHISPEVRQKLDEKIKQQFTNAIRVLRENKADVLGVTEKFYRNNRKQLLKFNQVQENSDNFLNYVNFKLNLIIRAD